MKNLEEEVFNYLKERKWDTLRPGDLSKSISIEAAELLELFQWNNPSLEEVRKNDELSAKVKKELADVLIYCLDLSVLMGFDTEEIIKEKLEYIRAKYPKEIFANSSIEPGTEKEYWEIKEKHRRKNTD